MEFDKTNESSSRETIVVNFDAYGQAVVHLAWYCNDKTCELLFGMVEFRPQELPHARGCGTKRMRIGGKGRRHINYTRYALSVSYAIKWYGDVVDGHLVFPTDTHDPTTDKIVDLNGGPFVQEPRWPGHVMSNDLAFAPDWMQGSNAHFLFPKNTVSLEIMETIKSEKARRQLGDWLNFDIVGTYSDYLGSLSLVAPNPIFRGIDKSHVEQSTPASGETLAYKVVARAGQRLNGLRLEVINERLRGRMAPMVHEFGDDAIVQFNSSSEIYKEGRSVTHPNYGVLSWHEPLPLLRTISVSWEVSKRKKHIHVPSMGRRWPKYEYEVDEVEPAGDFTVGDAIDDKDVIARLIEAQQRRSRRHAAEVQEQVWFYSASADAAQYVRSKIGGARKTVLIVDPYFSSVSLMAFGHATRRPDVDLQILTSVEGLKRPASSDPALEEGVILQKALDETFDQVSAKPAIRVLAGKPSPIHDRFLVIDGEVWLSGNSLSTLGERAGMIVRLPDPGPVISRLEAFWSRSRVLADWLSEGAAARERA